MKKAFHLLLFLLLAAPSFAVNVNDDVFFINGTVKDKNTNESLAGVEVRVKGTSIVTYTDFDGNFFLPELPSGSYELSFNYITYQSTQIVNGNCGNCTTLNVAMDQR